MHSNISNNFFKIWNDYYENWNTFYTIPLSAIFFYSCVWVSISLGIDWQILVAIFVRTWFIYNFRCELNKSLSAVLWTFESCSTMGIPSRPGKRVSSVGFGWYPIGSGMIRVYAFFSGIGSWSGMFGSGFHSGCLGKYRSVRVWFMSFRVQIYIFWTGFGSGSI